MVDTWPTETTPGWTALASPSTAAEDHGFGLARVIEDLLCDQGRCVADVESFQALVLDHNLVRVPSGPGTHGRLVDLARAIYRGIRAHDTARGDSNRRTIMNLSVAWSPGSPAGGSRGSREAGEFGPAAAVHEVLEYAACRGVLIMAAAGNDLGGTDSDDVSAVYPAAWNSMSALSTSQCAAQFGMNGGIAGGALVQAVGGVAGGSQPLAIGRRGSEPTLVAEAVHAASSVSPAGGVPTRVMSGTSVASAVAAAAAAAVAYDAPAADRNLWLTTLYSRSMSLGRAAALRYGTTTDVRRTNVCAGFAGASCATCPAMCASSFVNPLTGPVTATRLTTTTSTCAVPDPNGPPVADSCSTMSTSIDELPATVPQPGETGCAVCYVLNGGRELYMDIIAGTTVAPSWLYYEDAIGQRLGVNLSTMGDFDPHMSGHPVVHSVRLDVVTPAGFDAVGAKVFFILKDEYGAAIGTTASELGVY